MADRPNVMIIPGITLEWARKEIMEMKHESPCIECSERKFYARRFDIHISGEDCPYKCEAYEKWKTEQIEKAQEEIKQLRGMLKKQEAVEPIKGINIIDTDQPQKIYPLEPEGR